MKTLISAAALLIAASASAQKIEIAELPAPALNFIEKHFPGIPVTTTKKDVEDGQKGYKVILANGTSIGFHKDGSYREVDGDDNPIPTGFIDPKIVSYIKTHYPDRKITSIDYERNRVDVDLTGKMDLEFTKDGAFIRGKKDK